MLVGEGDGDDGEGEDEAADAYDALVPGWMEFPPEIVTYDLAIAALLPCVHPPTRQEAE